MALQAVIKEQDGMLILQIGYNMLMAKYLNNLPRKQCEFRGENKCWYINLIHKDDVITFLKKLNYEITNLDDAIPTGNDCYSILGLQSIAVWEVCEAAYKALARINHPDFGGNVEVMQSINSAWTEIKLKRGK